MTVSYSSLPIPHPRTPPGNLRKMLSLQRSQSSTHGSFNPLIMPCFPHVFWPLFQRSLHWRKTSGLNDEKPAMACHWDGQKSLSEVLKVCRNCAEIVHLHCDDPAKSANASCPFLLQSLRCSNYIELQGMETSC